MSEDLVGRRVVVRRRAGERDGRPVFADVLGELIASGDPLVVRRPDGSTVAVPSAEVHRLRPVPPGRAEIAELEEAAALGWPALETERLGDWLLRAGEGWTRRANSALVLGDPGVPAALDRVREWYAERGLPAWLAIPLPVMAPVDHAAARAGWASAVEVEVLTAPLPPGPRIPTCAWRPPRARSGRRSTRREPCHPWGIASWPLRRRSPSARSSRTGSRSRSAAAW
jgi:hypothetical protein